MRKNIIHESMHRILRNNYRLSEIIELHHYTSSGAPRERDCSCNKRPTPYLNLLYETQIFKQSNIDPIQKVDNFDKFDSTTKGEGIGPTD